MDTNSKTFEFSKRIIIESVKSYGKKRKKQVNADDQSDFTFRTDNVVKHREQIGPGIGRGKSKYSTW